MATLSQFKAQAGGQMLSLLPSAASSPGLGLNLDIYAAVGMQTQGMLSGGLTSIELANISLGIDMSQRANDAATADSGSPDASAADAASAHAVSPPATAAPSSHTNTVLNAILKADGFVAPEENAYAVQTDFFAQPASPAAGPAPAYFTNSSLANPGLGGLLNSLG